MKTLLLVRHIRDALPIFALLALSACATYTGDQEGGISGTGNEINCEVEKNQRDPQCEEP